MMIVVITIIAVLLGIIGYLYFNDSEKPHDLTEAYKPGDTISSEGSRAATAEPFAENLCVSEPDVDLLNVNFQYADEHGLLFNLETKEAKFASGIYDRIYPASITKIMTAILYIKYANPDDKVTITTEDVSLGEGSQVAGLEPGDTVTMQQLFLVLCLVTFFITKDKWGEILLLCSLMAVYISSSWMYTCVYIIPVVLVFFAEKDDKPIQINKSNWTDLIGFILFLCVFSYTYGLNYRFIYDSISVLTALYCVVIILRFAYGRILHRLSNMSA